MRSGSDRRRHTIPRRLDDPERWLFWTVDEAAALMGPALLGLAANQFVPGLIAGVGGWLLLRRVKRGGGTNIARYALYWFLPDFVLRLKATPPSHLPRLEPRRCPAPPARRRARAARLAPPGGSRHRACQGIGHEQIRPHLDSTLIMAADTVSGYVKALLEGVEFRRNTYTLDRPTRRTAINDMLIEARPRTQKDAFDHASSVR